MAQVDKPDPTTQKEPLQEGKRPKNKKNKGKKFEKVTILYHYSPSNIQKTCSNHQICP